MSKITDALVLKTKEDDFFHTGDTVYLVFNDHTPLMVIGGSFDQHSVKCIYFDKHGVIHAVCVPPECLQKIGDENE